MKLFLLITGLLALAVFGMAVKIIFKKGGRFDKTCASASRIFGKESEGQPCGFCGAMPDEQCKNEETTA
ncbi:MAG: membrane or secreted protein [Flavobacteriales bacterium]|nr:membrane or secreted protein [Flavobacteriales bacterium]